jgi:hypothetical protein
MGLLMALKLSIYHDFEGVEFTGRDGLGDGLRDAVSFLTANNYEFP